MMLPRKTETEEEVKTTVFVLSNHDEPLETLNLVIALTVPNQGSYNGNGVVKPFWLKSSFTTFMSSCKSLTSIITRLSKGQNRTHTEPFLRGQHTPGLLQSVSH